ncbi:MAG: DUF58 domain-containing protein [Magnetococcales bacterium]|nr:DUF58 domain-containing protein [Magnetococcales bacterium]
MRRVQAFLYPAYRRFVGRQYRFRRRVTGLGRAFIAGLLVTGVLGLDTRMNALHQLFALLLGLSLTSLAWLPFFRGRFALHRELPPFCSAGVATAYRVRVTNLTSRWQKGLRLLEELADPRPDLAAFLAAREPGEEERNPFDRMLGFHRFAWLTARSQAAAPVNVAIPPLAPGGEVWITVPFQPVRRGVARFLGVTLARPDPLGLVQSLRFVPLPQTLTVLPRRRPLPSGLALPPGGRRYQRGGVSLAGSVGDAEEFHHLREYRPGDSPRHIHWPSLAKLEKPMVRAFREEFFLRYGLVLDTFSPWADDRFEAAVSLAASLAATVESGDSLLDLLFVGRCGHRFTMGRGVGHAAHILEILAKVEPGAGESFHQLSALVLDHLATLSGLMLILLAWDPPRRELVARLRGRGVPVAVVLMAGIGEQTDPGPMADDPGRFQIVEAARW